MNNEQIELITARRIYATSTTELLKKAVEIDKLDLTNEEKNFMFQSFIRHYAISQKEGALIFFRNQLEEQTV
ncbi:MAG: hypothetical protein ACTSP4_00580 [Candidatus Hodarchaeales archaeon]